VIAIRNPHLLRAVVQRTYRGVTPPRTITAPEPCTRADLLSERERLATFERSRTFHASSPGSSPLPSPESASGELAPNSEDAP
jgi:hypothetical protein